MEGSVLEVTVKPDFIVEKVKTIAVNHFYGDDESKLPSTFRLVHANNFKALIDRQKLSEEDCNDSGKTMYMYIKFLKKKYILYYREYAV